MLTQTPAQGSIPADPQIIDTRVATLGRRARPQTTGEPLTLASVYALITGPELVDMTAAVRAKDSDSSAYTATKKLLTTIIPALDAPAGTLVKGMDHIPNGLYNGLYGFDLDEWGDQDPDPARAVALAATIPGCCITARSAGRTGAWAIIAATPAQDSDDYKARWRWLADNVLPPELRAISGESSKNANRLRYLAHDPQAWLNATATPVHIPEPDPFAPAKPATAAPDSQPAAAAQKGRFPQSNVALLSDHIIEGALDAMAAQQAGADDSHLLAVLANLRDLGYPFDRFDTWAVAAGCTCSDRRTRWDHPPNTKPTDRPDWAIVNLAKKHYGFQLPTRPAARSSHGNTASPDEPPAREAEREPTKRSDSASQGVPMFSYYSVGLVGAIHQAGYEIRYNARAIRHEVRPTTVAKQDELHPTAKPWPYGWLHVDDSVEAKLLELLAYRAHTNGKNNQPERYSPTVAQFTQAMKVIRNDCKIDPWTAYLQQKPSWDRTPRIDTMAQDCWGVLDASPDVDLRLVAQWGRCLMNGLSSRLLVPGCAVHTITIMTGLEGRGKSLGLKRLFDDVWQPHLFTDSLDFNALTDSKLTIEKTAGVMLAEIPEMNQLGTRQLDSVKAAISRDKDRARLAYDRATSDIPRNFHIASTSNNDTPLPDDITNRRFLPLRASDGCTGDRVMAYMAENRDQLWAEALHTSQEDPLRQLVPYRLQLAQQEHNATAVDKTELVDAIIQAIEVSGASQGTMLELVLASGFFTRNSRGSDGSDETVPLSESEVAEKLDNKSLQTKLGRGLNRNGWYTAEQNGSRRSARTYVHPHSSEPGFNDGA